MPQRYLISFYFVSGMCCSELTGVRVITSVCHNGKSILNILNKGKQPWGTKSFFATWDYGTQAPSLSYKFSPWRSWHACWQLIPIPIRNVNMCKHIFIKYIYSVRAGAWDPCIGFSVLYVYNVFTSLNANRLEWE